jgi:hypothetical protein
MADRAHSPHQAVADAINSVACELAYIGELAEILFTSAGSSDTTPNQIEALAHSIKLMQEKVDTGLHAHLDAIAEVSHG